MEFFRQEFWSGLPFYTPGDLPNPGIEPKSLLSPALVGGFLIHVANFWCPLKCLAHRNGSLSLSRLWDLDSGGCKFKS